MTDRRLSTRRGFTLAEMVVALLLFSMIGGSILSLVMRQQRFYRSTADVIQLQSQLRQGASILPLDLRELSTGDTTANGIVADKAVNYNADIYARSDWFIEFRRIFGSGMICSSPVASSDTIVLLPKQVVINDTVVSLSSWGIAPVAGDSLLILDEGKMVGVADDRWVKYEVEAVVEAKGTKGCPWRDGTKAWPVLAATDTVYPSYKIAISPALPVKPTIFVGAPVRFFRRARYEIYQAADQQWYLGYSDCIRTYPTENQCSEVTPTSGPYLPYTGVPGENGFNLTYYDSLGNPLASTSPSRLISRIEVIMRTVTNNVTRTGAGTGEQYRDSLVLSIGIRNRR